MAPDRGHFHHRLIDMGLSQKQAVAILYSVSAILGLAAVVITTSGEIKAIILVIAFALAIAIGAFVMKSHIFEMHGREEQAQNENAAQKKDLSAAEKDTDKSDEEKEE